LKESGQTIDEFLAYSANKNEAERYIELQGTVQTVVWLELFYQVIFSVQSYQRLKQQMP
jgi:hypothetical protein